MPEYFSKMASLLVQMFGTTSNGLPFFCAMLMILVVSTTFMSTLLAGFYEIQRVFTRKIFHEKYTLQAIETTLFVCILSFILQSTFFLIHSSVTLSGGGVYLLELFEENNGKNSLLKTFSPRLIQLFCTFTLLLFLGLCCFVWRKVKKKTFFRLLILVPSVLLAGGGLFWVFTLSFPVQKIFAPFVYESLTAGNKFILFFTSSPFILPSFLWLSTTGLVTAMLFLGVWLIFWRNHVNFGRDYYVFAMHSFARATLCTLLLCLLSVALLAYVFIVNIQGAIQAEVISYLSIYTSIIVCITILLSRMALSQTPMRYKLSVVFSFLLFFFASFLPVFSIFLIFNT